MKYIWFENSIIELLLSSKGKLEVAKDYELLVAIMLNKFCEKQWKTKCCIGLELNNKYDHEISQKKSANLEELKHIIKKMVEEDTPIDVVIAKSTQGVNKPGMAFQIKRFGKDPQRKSTSHLLSFLNQDCRLFGKTDAYLVVALETDEELDFDNLLQSLNTVNYPFKGVMLLGLKDSMVTYYELWPSQGMEEIDMAEFMS